MAIQSNRGFRLGMVGVCAFFGLAGLYFLYPTAWWQYKPFMTGATVLTAITGGLLARISFISDFRAAYL